MVRARTNRLRSDNNLDMTDTSNPWRTLARREVYDNAWINVTEHAVIRPDGEPGIYGVVRYKNTAIGVLAIDAEDYVYLVGQYRYTLNAYSWEIPEGGCRLGEDWLAAAQRELAEETGLQAAQWEQLGTAHLSNSVSDELAVWYLATDLTVGEAAPEGTEVLQTKRVPFAEALQMVLTGEITDALSVLALLHYQVRRTA